MNVIPISYASIPLFLVVSIVMRYNLPFVNIDSFLPKVLALMLLVNNFGGIRSSVIIGSKRGSCWCFVMVSIDEEMQQECA